MNTPAETIRTNLREAGLRATPARVAVLRVLERHRNPLTVQAVLPKLADTNPDQATVYRILRSLTAAGLVQEVFVTKGVSSYEIADRPHHHHLICEQCGYVEDVSSCCDDPTPKTTSFQRITSHNLEFTGVCKKCAA